MSMDIRKALFEAKRRFLRDPNVVAVGIGTKRVGGRDTGETCISVSVKKKRQYIADKFFVEPIFRGHRTDVNETGEIVAEMFRWSYLTYDRVRGTFQNDGPLSLTQRRRPCPPGYSVGSYRITAGTLGAWLYDGAGERVMLSNNHVLANCGNCIPGDDILQPGPTDGGDRPAFGRLLEYVRINFDGKDKKPLADAYWKAWRWLPNLLAKLVGCPYRLRVMRGEADPHTVDQPSPNLVDAATADVREGWVEKEYAKIGKPAVGFQELALGDRVQKVGRTTERTSGTVSAVDVMTRVSYGMHGVATFDDQLEIRADDGEFSAPGDSGSTILTDDDNLRIGGLLFAGSSGLEPVTIANRISHVVTLLGLRF